MNIVYQFADKVSYCQGSFIYRNSEVFFGNTCNNKFNDKRNSQV